MSKLVLGITFLLSSWKNPATLHEKMESALFSRRDGLKKELAVLAESAAQNDFEKSNLLIQMVSKVRALYSLHIRLTFYPQHHSQ